MTVERQELTTQHQIIWNKLRTMPDGERMVGVDLQNIAGVPDRRAFYQIIEDLRSSGIFVGASRNSPYGYYEIRTSKEMERFLARKRNQLRREADALDNMEAAWITKEENKAEVL